MADYMIWVSGGIYPTRAEYLEEVRRLGASHKLPGLGLARSLAAPDTVVYLAHDDGLADDCQACLGSVECGECRRRLGEIEAWRAEMPTGDLTGRQQQVRRTRERRIMRAEQQISACRQCHGAGTYEAGTGGTVRLRDGSVWDYRCYAYWMRQPKRFSRDIVVDVEMCAECGGTGLRPRGFVFAAFRPRVQLVLSRAERRGEGCSVPAFERVTAAEAAREPERRGSTTSRARRLVRREPGFYATGRGGKKPSTRGLELSDSLDRMRVIEVIGDVVAFEPIALPGRKRFRGVAACDGVACS